MKIALDIDDVLASFYPAICNRMGMPEKKVNIWDGEVACNWIVKAMPLVEYDIDFWKNLKTLSNPSSIDFNVDCYITSSPVHLITIRARWLLDNGFPERPIFSTSDKLGLMIDREIDILIDDKIPTIDLVNNSGKIGIQFKPPYMTEEISDKSKIITHLSEISQKSLTRIKK